MDVPKILSVKPLENKRLAVVFTNGQEKMYDCKPLLHREMFSPLGNDAYFKNVRVDLGGYGIVWDDEIDLSEYELWTNGQELPLAA